MWQYTKRKMIFGRKSVLPNEAFDIPYEAGRQELKEKTKMGAKNVLWLGCFFLN
jgi:hypothetical protein